ncbi:ATP-binding cassette domain-containing protein [Rhodococcus artemisiae]|uniref:ATP-binding cassette domain-containing protein n=1 Tax=Rhodococcus artemisiae TaxID=714159 RepID=A0ABU7LH36_9NOCA|nr:ATP-binding cassette domain-containing protein [Rhodococcus artemisiae]MEE2060873.1 ATP-binding cassette domain-containing protein [Rhodococcus artemisiae]
MMTVHGDPLIEFDKVGLSREGRVIVDDVSLRLDAGEILVILGESGLGKTTVLHAAAGLLEPSSGTVTRRCERQGMLFQEARLLPWMSVGRNVRLAAPGRSAWSPGPHPEVDRALDEVGLRDVADLPPFRLSGGMQRRAALARALFARPSVVFADEPFAHLDSASAKTVGVALGRAAAEGTGVLMTAHEITDVFTTMGIYRTLFL